MPVHSGKEAETVQTSEDESPQFAGGTGEEPIRETPSVSLPDDKAINTALPEDKNGETAQPGETAASIADANENAESAVQTDGANETEIPAEVKTISTAEPEPAAEMVVNHEIPTQAEITTKETAAVMSIAEPQPTAEMIINKEIPTQTQTEITTTETAAHTSERSDPNIEPPDLPEIYHSSLLPAQSLPHQYENDNCRIIKNRWGEGKAAPGTVVMPIMYRGIVKGSTAKKDTSITAEQHRQLIDELHRQGFTAINTEQFIAFLKNNEWIPERSVLLIVDDKHSEQHFIDNFKIYYDAWSWPVINGWISMANTSKQLWAENTGLEESGLVDHQSMGTVRGVFMNDDSDDGILSNALKGSAEAIQEHFNKTPQAIIWPGGSFGNRPIEAAKAYGYQIGFTMNQRGPIMYNWIPLSDASDPSSSDVRTDGSQDPLFVIPRYWAPDALPQVDIVRQIGDSAREYYESIRKTELEYYDIVCKPSMGEL